MIFGHKIIPVSSTFNTIRVDNTGIFLRKFSDYFRLYIFFCEFYSIYISILIN